MRFKIVYDAAAPEWPYIVGFFTVLREGRTRVVDLTLISNKKTIGTANVADVMRALPEKIRHEVQHGVQEAEGRLVDPDTIGIRYINDPVRGPVPEPTVENLTRYLLSKNEVEAYTSAVPYMSRMLGISAEQALLRIIGEIGVRLGYLGVSKADALEIQRRFIKLADLAGALRYNGLTENDAKKVVQEAEMRYGATIGAVTDADIDAKIDALYGNFGKFVDELDTYTPKRAIEAIEFFNDTAFEIAKEAKVADIKLKAEAVERIRTFLSVSSNGAYYLWLSMSPQYHRGEITRLTIRLLKDVDFQSQFWSLRDYSFAEQSHIRGYVESFRDEFFFTFGRLRPDDTIAQQRAEMVRDQNYTEAFNSLKAMLPYLREPLTLEEVGYLMRPAPSTGREAARHNEAIRRVNAKMNPTPLPPNARLTEPFISRPVRAPHRFLGSLTESQATAVDTVLGKITRSVVKSNNLGSSLRAYEVGDYLLRSADLVDAGAQDPVAFFSNVERAGALIETYEAGDLKTGIIAAVAFAGVLGLIFYLSKRV